MEHQAAVFLKAAPTSRHQQKDGTLFSLSYQPIGESFRAMLSKMRLESRIIEASFRENKMFLSIPAVHLEADQGYAELIVYVAKSMRHSGSLASCGLGHYLSK